MQKAVWNTTKSEEKERARRIFEVRTRTGAEVARGAPYGLVNLTLPARELPRQQGQGINGARENEREITREV